jgi:hypothetical protein
LSLEFPREAPRASEGPRRPSHRTPKILSNWKLPCSPICHDAEGETGVGSGEGAITPLGSQCCLSFSPRVETEDTISQIPPLLLWTPK